MTLDIQRVRSEVSRLLVEPDSEAKEHSDWLHHNWSIGYLLKASSGISPIYISVDGFYLYTILVPLSSLAGDYVQDLLNWNFMVSGGWGYSVWTQDGEEVFEVAPPLDFTGSRLLDGNQPIVYLREFYGNPRGKESYLELDQPIAHILDLHWVEKRHSYCRLDHLGDIQAVVAFSSDDGFVALADFTRLEFYQHLTQTVMLRVFEVMHWKGTPWSGDSRSEQTVSRETAHSELHARLVVDSGAQSYLSGCLAK